jgi:chaperonin GroES
MESANRPVVADERAGFAVFRGGFAQRRPRRSTNVNPYPQGRNSMKFRPLHDRVVVEPLEEEEKTAGGIIIPDSAKEKPMQGKVIAVGPGARGDDGTVNALDVKKNDRVLYGKWSGTEVKIDGKNLLIMRESDIMGVIE